MAECITYTKLSNADRNQKNLTNLKKPKCDSLVRGWYRFYGSAGKKMPTQCVPKNHCNTHAPGWMNGAHPQVQDGIVHRTVCFNWLSSCCYWKAAISVRNCSGFYVYYLGKPPACRLRYCGANWGLPERPPLVSDHLTKIPIGSSVNQIAISETSHKRPPLVSDHLTKIPIGSSNCY